MSSSFSLRAGNELATALATRLGERHGIRVLAIKGLVADHHRLRPPRESADADIWVDPDCVDEFRDLLVARGWHTRHEREVPSLLGAHSVTLIHDEWPNDVDLHFSFPGFFADPREVFDRLWRTRESIEVAHVRIDIPSRGASAVIAGLHALRYSRSSRHRDELRHLNAALSEKATDDEIREFVDVAAVGRAQWVLRDIFTELGRTPSVDAAPREQQLWNLNRATIEDGAATSWVVTLRAAPLQKKPGVLFRALWISRAEIPRNHAQDVPTRAETWFYRWRRWRRGARSIARYVRLADAGARTRRAEPE